MEQFADSVFKNISELDGTTRDLCDSINKKILASQYALHTPATASINQCIENWYDGPEDFNTLTNARVVKIEFTINDDTEVFTFCNTIATPKADENTRQGIDFLHKLKRSVKKHIQQVDETIDLKRYIEKYLETFDNSEYELVFVDNCMCTETKIIRSKRHKNDDFMDKYMILGYKKYYYEDDTIATEEDINFELEVGDSLDMNFTVELVHKNSKKTCNYKELEPHMYKKGDIRYNLKLASARNLCSRIIKEHPNNGGFYLTTYSQLVRDRLGLQECILNGVIEPYPIRIASCDTLAVKFKATKTK